MEKLLENVGVRNSNQERGKDEIVSRASLLPCVTSSFEWGRRLIKFPPQVPKQGTPPVHSMAESVGGSYGGSPNVRPANR